MPAFQTEDDLLHFLDKIDQEAADGRGDLNKRIEENIDLARGKQWRGKTSPWFLYNIIESCIEDKIGKLSETRPKINVRPTKNGLGVPAKVLSKAVSGIWDKRKFEYKSERVAAWGMAAGVAFIGTPYNRDLDNGVGDVDIVIKDPRYCGVDIAVRSAEDAGASGEYMVIEDCVALDKIRAEYPGRGALVKADERVSGYNISQSPHQESARTMIRAAFERLTQKAGDRKISAIPKAIPKEYYVQDRRKSINDLGVVPIVSGLTNWAPEGIPFPGGRRIIRCGDVILEDTFNPYWDGLPPLDMMSWKVDLETAWSADEIQSVKRMQECVNRLGDAWAKTAIINSTVRMMIEAGALSPDERNKISNEVAQMIVVNPGRKVDWIVPPLLSNDVIGFVEKLLSWIRTKLGTSEIPTQKQVPSIITGPAIEGLQLMVETPIRTAARRVEEFYQRIGQKLISRVIQYYTSDRIIHLIGAGNEWTEFEFKRREILLDAQGNPRSEEDLRKAFQDFYFTIEPQSSLAITKTQRASMAFALVQAGILHPKKVLEAADFENPEELLAEAQDAKEKGLFDVIAGASKNGGGGLQRTFSNGGIEG